MISKEADLVLFEIERSSAWCLWRCSALIDRFWKEQIEMKLGAIAVGAFKVAIVTGGGLDEVGGDLGPSVTVLRRDSDG